MASVVLPSVCLPSLHVSMRNGVRLRDKECKGVFNYTGIVLFHKCGFWCTNQMKLCL